MFWGDILTGMAVVALLHRSARIKIVFGVVSAALWGIGTVALSLQGPGGVPMSPDYVTSILERSEVFVFWTGLNALALTHLAPMLVGVALFHLGALHRPTAHLALHRKLAVAGLAVGLAGAIPLCLISAGAWAPPVELGAAAMGLHTLTGLAQGIGYVSMIALWSARRTAAGGAARLFVAIGCRSLTVYLLHAVLLGLLLSAWAFDLAPHLSLSATLLLGLGIWVFCAAVALTLAALRLPGPAEVLLRRLSYGRGTADAKDAGR